MPSIIDHLTEIYVFIDDHLKQHPEKAQWRGSNNSEPVFSDTEVLTIGLSQGVLGVQSLKRPIRRFVTIIKRPFRICPVTNNGSPVYTRLSHLVSDLLVASTALLSDHQNST